MKKIRWQMVMEGTPDTEMIKCASDIDKRMRSAGYTLYYK